MQTLASGGQLTALLHRGFWQPMDALRDKDRLEELWQKETSSWKYW